MDFHPRVFCFFYPSKFSQKSKLIRGLPQSGSFQNLNARAIWRSVYIQIFEDLSKGIYDDLDILRSRF